jgi:hypothetical protein
MKHLRSRRLKAEGHHAWKCRVNADREHFPQWQTRVLGDPGEFCLDLLRPSLCSLFWGNKSLNYKPN